MKKALVIAGGQWQMPLILFLQHNKYEVTVVDPYKTSQGVKIADKHIQIDVREKEKILSAITEHYDIVATDQSDVSVETVAFIAENLKLRGNKLSVVKCFSNKYESRKYASKIGVPIPNFAEISTIEDLKLFIKQIGVPLIIKPCDAQSSKGIHKIESNTSDIELNLFLQDALNYSYEKNCIIEQFVEGYEITLEGFCSQGVHKTLAISKKKHFKTGIASTLRYSDAMPATLEKKIIEANDKYVENSGLNFGPTHAEYIVNEIQGTFWLVEIACRGGGTLISSDIVKWVSGFDVYQNYLDCLEGKEVSIKNYLPTKKYAELHFFEFGEGVIEDIKGVEDIKKIKGVLWFDFPHKVGDKIYSCQDDRSRQGFVIVIAETLMDLENILLQVNQTLTVKINEK